MTRKLLGYLGVAATALAIGGMLGAVWYQSRLQSIVYFQSHQEFYRLSKARRPIVMLGDSLIAGAPWNEMTICPNVVLRAVAGDTSVDVLNRLDDVIALRPSAVFLMVGTNDMTHGVSISDTAENIGRIVSKLSGSAVFVHYILPVGERIERSKAVMERISALNMALSSALQPLPADRLIDLRPQVTGADGYLKPALTVDGVHLTPLAYAIWRDRIEPAVIKFCPTVN